ncbi:MAG TPA: glycosyltransferase family 39 protein [Gaiellaceae bacterium]|nr:glycosyltransferase family 39 protein [Gaiellaceae bacterium]
MGTKPYFEDEAVAGLIAARPLPEVVHTVLWERGGSPLHFVLAHFVLSVWPTVGALRWLSVACALGAVVCAYALGRELAGDLAGAVAAWIVATSALLNVYGTFGRMYSLLALVGGLNMLLFLRALERPTQLRVSLAAASAWLLAATHPFGGIPVALEALVAAWLWWPGRDVRRTIPVILAGIATAPLAVAELRLALRFDVSASNGKALGSGGSAGTQLDSAARGFAGGSSVLFWIFLVLALVGAVVVARRSLLLVFVGAAALLLPPLLSLLARVQDTTTAFLSARHLMLSLPFWAALIGVATVRLAAWPSARAVAPLAAAAAVSLLAVVTPASARDPRTHFVFLAQAGDVHTSAAVGAWLSQRIEPGDLLFPYSVPYLRALKAARQARSLPRGQARTLVASVDDVHDAQRLWIAVPLGASEKPLPAQLRALRRTDVVQVFPRWLIVGARPPLSGRKQILRSVVATVDAAAALIPHSDTVHQYQDVARQALARG